jgi:hypothetical protein
LKGASGRIGFTLDLDGPWEELRTAGRVQARLGSLDLTRIQATGVEADLPIGRDEEGTLRCETLEVAGLKAERVELPLRVEGAHMKALRPVEASALGGQIVLEGLDLRWNPFPQLEGSASVVLKSVQLPPTWIGPVEGRFDSISFGPDGVRVKDGSVSASAFGGRVRLDGLEVTDPTGEFTSIGVWGEFEGIRLESVSSQLTSYPLVRGDVGGFVRAQVFHTGEPLEFEVGVVGGEGTVEVAQLRKWLGEGEKVSSEVMSNLAEAPDVFSFSKVGVWGRLSRGQLVQVRGKFARNPGALQIREYDWDELRRGVVEERKEECLLVGGGWRQVNVIHDTPVRRIRWAKFLERLRGVVPGKK